ncbi:MAG: type I methionyl aminopeptidase [bacterium]|nr:type I methionyl aminopeptidase [Candidatus Wildermuthbacteria bacterium]MDP2664399.1 type I methionyl aminopeptidase [bacterium]
MTSIKTPQEIKAMQEGGKILARIVKEVSLAIRPGVTTKELNRAAEALILQSGALLAFKGYEDFPEAMCVSVNEEIVHVVPSTRVLKEGDMVTLDLGLIWKGFYLDMARTFPVGIVSPEVSRLIRITKKALRIGIKKAKVGNTVGDIGNTIQRLVEDQGYGVVRELCGHGIGKGLHEDPKIPNYGKRKNGEELEEGMVICIEPMITIGDWKLVLMEDGHGYKTKDGSLSCHFEDTIAITSKGPLVLTQDS